MPKALRDDDIVHVADQVYLVTGSNTNWVIVKDGGNATLIDTGYPADQDRLLAAVAAVGVQPAAVTAVLITHAHTDHLGSAEHLRTSHGVPVLMHEEEVPHARRDFLDQVSVGQLMGQIWRPGVLPWVVHALRAGGTTHVSVAEPLPFPAPGALGLPGGPVPVHTPGHTKGHCAYHLPGGGILVSGDALVTAHPTSRIDGPQLLPEMFHSHRTDAVDALKVLEGIDADILLPATGRPITARSRPPPPSPWNAPGTENGRRRGRSPPPEKLRRSGGASCASAERPSPPTRPVRRPLAATASPRSSVVTPTPGG